MSAAAARQRRHRSRQNEGRVVVAVEVDGEAIALLCEAGLLDPRADFHDRADIGDAIGLFLSLARRA